MGFHRTRWGMTADFGLIGFFLAFLAWPTVRNMLGPPPVPATENRLPAPRPRWAWDWAAVNDFPAQFEAFYNDYFGARGTLIHWLNVAKVQWLKTSSSANVLIGKRGWLFYTVKQVGNDFPAARPYTPEELARWRQALEARRDWLAGRGIAYLFVVAPDKQSVYPEDLPRAVKGRQKYRSRLDQLVSYLKDQSDFRIVDLREPLRREKARERLYDFTDSHWNDRGAYVAYRELVEALAPRFPGMRPLPRSAFAEVVVRTAGGDLAHMLGVDDRTSEDHLNLDPLTPRRARRLDAGYRVPLPPLMQPFATERDDPKLPRAVVFRDSFAGNLIPFLGEHFRRAFYLWQELNEFDRAVVEREKPDVVIQEIVERKLSLGAP